MKRRSFIFAFVVWFIQTNAVIGQMVSLRDTEKEFQNPPPSAQPWVIWYWMHGAVSKEGIRADLEAMKEVGIGGAYLMFIQDTLSRIPFQPTARQLSNEWWKLVNFAMQEAKRLQLKLGIHVGDGWAVAGGPWITAPLSMQKLVWTKNYLKETDTGGIPLSQPLTNENYYKDIAVFAYPANSEYAFNNTTLIPAVTTSNGTKANFLSFTGDDKESFRSDTTCWIQYKYPKSFTCRSIKIKTGGNNFQAHRLIVQAGDDGENFKTIKRLEPPRHGWQDTDEDVTHSIPATTARYFRFVYDKRGSEPGAEDLDAAKWKPSFKVIGIYLSDEPVIDQFESKNGSVWRISKPATEEQIPSTAAILLENIIDVSDKMNRDGVFNWNNRKGNWVIVRIGHTSTGHTNNTAGAAEGLECDKFSPGAVKLQFDNWFAKFFNQTDKGLARQVVKVFHVDSWECGSQNWSPGFAAEFKKRRNYDPLPYLVAMAGVPVEDAETSEKFLHDMRQTIAELVNDIFYGELKKYAQKFGCIVSTETVAPTMVSDGLLHYKNAHMPMGEFWVNSPTHDKPNDMLDAISGAHIYGKNIVQAEAFTSVRMNWSEHPGNLKTLGDRNFALGMNKIALHVFTHNPWLDKKPGMTLDGVGLYFQRDQTWFRQSKAWINYLTRCQALLQMGEPVADIAVFTGEEVPRRSILPDRLVNTLPGIFGKEKVEKEKQRLANIGHPMRSIPDGVNHSANMADPEDWIDPLNGYAYDSFNPDALMMMKMENGKIVLPGGKTYSILVIPGKHPMQPAADRLSLASAKKLLSLAKNGATILMSPEYKYSTTLKENDDSVKLIVKELFNNRSRNNKLIPIPYIDSSFESLGIQKDIEIIPNDHSVAWTHRRTDDGDIYFISNQKDSSRTLRLSLRAVGKHVEVYDPVTGLIQDRSDLTHRNGRTDMLLELEGNQSLFIVLKQKREVHRLISDASLAVIKKQTIPGPWSLQFDKKFGGPANPVTIPELKSWTDLTDKSIRFYSGTAVYSTTFSWNEKGKRSASLQLDSVYNIATIKINGIDCGTIWTKPYRVDISKAIRNGENKVEIEVSNTWANRLIGDQDLPVEKRISWTTAPFRLKDKPLLPAGLVGQIVLIIK